MNNIRLYGLPELTCLCAAPQPAMYKHVLDTEEELFFVKCDNCDDEGDYQDSTDEAKQDWKETHARR